MSGHNVTELFAWVVDDPTGKHAILGFAAGGGPMVPCVSGKRHIIEQLRPLAEMSTKELGLPVLLLRFALAETVDVA